MLNGRKTTANVSVIYSFGLNLDKIMHMHNYAVYSGVVEGERGGTPFPQLFCWGTAFPHLLSWRGGTLIQ